MAEVTIDLNVDVTNNANSILFDIQEGKIKLESVIVRDHNPPTDEITRFHYPDEKTLRLGGGGNIRVRFTLIDEGGFLKVRFQSGPNVTADFVPTNLHQGVSQVHIPPSNHFSQRWPVTDAPTESTSAKPEREDLPVDPKFE